MRTTINLDDAAHEFAAYYARARRLTLSEAVNELIRKAEIAPAPPAPQLETGPHGLPLLPRTSGPITPEMVKKAEEEEFDPRKFA